MKIKKISVRNLIETLTDNELKNVIGGYGGGVFHCYCGFVGNPLSSSFIVGAHDILDALAQARTRCGGLGATCN